MSDSLSKQLILLITVLDYHILIQEVRRLHIKIQKYYIFQYPLKKENPR